MEQVEKKTWRELLQELLAASNELTGEFWEEMRRRLVSATCIEGVTPTLSWINSACRDDMLPINHPVRALADRIIGIERRQQAAKEEQRRAEARKEEEKRQAEARKREALERTRRHRTLRELASGKNLGKEAIEGHVPTLEEMRAGLLDSIDQNIIKLEEKITRLLNYQMAILDFLRSQTPEARREQRKIDARVKTYKRALEICEQRYRITDARDTILLAKTLRLIIVEKQLVDSRTAESLPYDDMLETIKLTPARRQRMNAILARAPQQPGSNGMRRKKPPVPGGES